MTDRPSFKARQFQAREDAILDAANRLLGEKGYDLMSLDDIASEVGIAKGSVYKHFPSKEALAAATMTRLLNRTVEEARGLPTAAPAIDRLRALLGWCLRERMAGGVPRLPSTSPGLQSSLLDHLGYLDAMEALDTMLTAWVDEARADGALRDDLPVAVVLFTISARSCARRSSSCARPANGATTRSSPSWSTPASPGSGRRRPRPLHRRASRRAARWRSSADGQPRAGRGGSIPA